jgi:hypothetical protein
LAINVGWKGGPQTGEIGHAIKDKTDPPPKKNTHKKLNKTENQSLHSPLHARLYEIGHKAKITMRLV